MVLGISFLIFCNINIQFAEKKLFQKTYYIVEILRIIKKIELIYKKHFAKTVIDENVKAFVAYVSSLSPR